MKPARQTRTKYLWLEAVNCYHEFKNQPGVLRLAAALFQFYNADDEQAWPSRETLASRLDSHPNTISSCTSKLVKAGALVTRKQGALDPALRKKSDARSLSYFLNLDWANRVLAERDGRERLTGQRPPARKSRHVVSSTIQSVMELTSEMGREVHDTNTLNPYSTEKLRRDGTEDTETSVYARHLDELPFDPAETEEERRAFLLKQGLSVTEAESLLPLLTAQRLRLSQIQEVLTRRKASATDAINRRGESRRPLSAANALPFRT